MDVWKYLREGTHSVLPSDSGTRWEPYLRRFYETRVWPRYYTASADVAAAGWRYRWGVLQGCFLLFKWVSMGGVKIHLALPPISISGDTGAELEVLRLLRESGISARLSKEDVDRYAGLDVSPCPNGPEFIYRAGDYLPEGLRGGTWNSWRYAQNAAHRQGWSATSWLVSATSSKALDAMQEVSARWTVARSKSSRHERKIACLLDFQGGISLVLSPNGTPSAWSAYQVVGGGHVVCMVRHWATTEFPGGDIARYAHMVDAWHLAATMGAGTLFNLGSGVGDVGLITSKRKFRPHYELPMFRMVTPRPITAEEWRASRGSTEPSEAGGLRA